jgi:hypothetical protein
MATVPGAHEVVFALREHGADMERGIADEVARLAQMAARRMRELAPKGHSSNLVNSIISRQVGAMAWEVRPSVAHAPYVEDGVKPGGKGLPRFFDPAAKSIVDWLQRTAFPGKHKNRLGSKALQSAELELRDRYQGLAWHIRHKGVKAQPFVAPTAREMEPIVLRRLDLAVRRVLAARPDAGSATA